MSDLRVGIVGLGWVAEAHIIAFEATTGAKVTAVCSSRNPSPAEVEARYNLPLKVYSKFEDMLADPNIDIVSICTMNQDHPWQTIAAVEAGKHVYVEKPVALNFDDLKAMRAAIKKSGKRACVGFECRFSMQLGLITSIIDRGLIGEVTYGEADYYHGIGPWYRQFCWSNTKAGGGSALLSGGCHAMDALLYLMNEPVEEVMSYSTKSRAECFSSYEFDPCSVTILKFANGKVGKVAASIDCLQPYHFHFQLVGSEGSILDNKISTKALDGLNPNKWTTLETSTLDSGEVLDHPYHPQMQAFVDAINNGTPVPLTDFEDAYETHKVIFAADLSLELGRPVKMSELID